VTAAQRGGLLASALLAAVGLAAVIGGAGYGVVVEDGEIGPGFLPVLAGGLVAAFAALDVVSRLRRRSDLPTQAELILDTPSRPDDNVVLADPSDPGAPSTSTQSIHSPVADDGVDILGRTQRQRNRMLAVVLGLVVVTLVMVQVVGFLLAFVLLLFVIAVFVERRRVLPSALVAVAAGAVTYAVFVALLSVPLPQGLLGLI